MIPDGPKTRKRRPKVTPGSQKVVKISKRWIKIGPPRVHIWGTWLGIWVSLLFLFSLLPLLSLLSLVAFLPLLFVLPLEKMRKNSPAWCSGANKSKNNDTRKLDHKTTGTHGCELVGRATALCAPSPSGLRVAASLRPNAAKTLETNFPERWF